MLEMADAEDMIADVISWKTPAVMVPIGQAVGCVIQQDVQSETCVPEFRTSIMDGYAVLSRSVAYSLLSLDVIDVFSSIVMALVYTLSLDEQWLVLTLQALPSPQAT